MKNLLFVLAMLSGCAFCENGNNKNTTECKAYNALLACGPGVAEIVMGDAALLASNLDAALLDLASRLAPSAYSCVSRIFSDTAASKFGAGSKEHAAMKDALARHPISTMPVKK